MATPSGATLGAAALLDRSVGYMLGALALVTPGMLDRTTPCAGWDLRTLLDHVEDGLRALAGAVTAGRVATLGPVRPAIPASDPAGAVRDAARAVLEGWSADHLRDDVEIDGLPISSALVGAAGGIEVAVHGWDIARAAGWRRPVPPPLAEEMIDLLPLLLTGAHGCMYAASVPVPEQDCAGDRLIAYLGRRPPGPVERRYLQSRAALLVAGC